MHEGVSVLGVSARHRGAPCARRLTRAAGVCQLGVTVASPACIRWAQVRLLPLARGNAVKCCGWWKYRTAFGKATLGYGGTVHETGPGLIPSRGGDVDGFDKP